MNHRVKWTIDEYGIVGDITCLSERCDFRADCPTVGCDPETLPAPGQECWTCGAEIVRVKECNGEVWLGLDDVGEHYAGSSAPLRSGLVIVEWLNGDFVWRYPEPAVVVVDKPDWA